MTKRLGDLTVSLIEFVTGVVNERGFGGERPFDNADPSTRITLRLVQNGRPVNSGWEVDGLRVSDARGRSWPMVGTYYVLVSDTGDFPISFQPALPPDPSPWKLRMELRRMTTASFSPEELWSVRGIILPRAGTTAHPGNTATRRGARLKLEDITAVGMDGPGSAALVRYLVHLRMEPPPASRDRRLLFLRATTAAGDKGVTLDTAKTQWRTPESGRGLHTLYLVLPQGTRPVDLHFAVERSRMVEFLAVPSRSKD